MRRNSVIFIIIAALLSALLFVHPTPSVALICAFKNPLIAQGQDPSVVFDGGYYYLVQATASAIQIRRAAQLTELGSAPAKSIFAPPSGTPYSADLWAPELVHLSSGWYIYFAADNSPGNNAAHRMFVLQADSTDPMGSWSFKGKVYHDAATDKWAIDGSILEYGGKLYMIWSGWSGDTGDFPQNLYIAQMIDPLTADVRHQIATPDQVWEKSVAAIEEGPEPFVHKGQVSIVYSADASWTAAYKLGLLVLRGTDPLDPASWSKRGVVFAQAGAVYGPGHNSTPITSPDGSQYWLVYHAKERAANGWDDRDVRAQPFIWAEDNTPQFGQPAQGGLPVPTGQPCGMVSAQPLDTKTGSGGTLVRGIDGGAIHFNGKTDYLDIGQRMVTTLDSYSVSAWVRLDVAGASDGVFVSQEGGIASAFALRLTQGKFAFSLFDPKGQLGAQAIAADAAQPARWYHVVGVRDVLNSRITLYIDGRLTGSASYDYDWDARAHTILGAAKFGSQRATFFMGSLDMVNFYNGALSDADVAALDAQMLTF